MLGARLLEARLLKERLLTGVAAAAGVCGAKGAAAARAIIVDAAAVSVEVSERGSSSKLEETSLFPSSAYSSPSSNSSPITGSSAPLVRINMV